MADLSQLANMPLRGKNDKETIIMLQDAYVRLKRDLEFYLNGNLDEENVIRAGSVVADWVYAGTLTADQINAVQGIKLGANATIQWGELPTLPTASQVGALPSDTYIPVVPSYIKSTYIDSTMVMSPVISGGVINGGSMYGGKFGGSGGSISGYIIIGDAGGSGAYGDLKLYRGEGSGYLYPIMNIYDNGGSNGMQIRAGTGTSDTKAVLSSSGDLTTLFGRWNFGAATVSGLTAKFA